MRPHLNEMRRKGANVAIIGNGLPAMAKGFVQRLGLSGEARVVRRGLPVHPGSSYWIVELEQRPVIGVASCGMFSRRTALDLLLTRLFAGEELDAGFLAGLGHGGLLAPEMAWRFPRYEALETEGD